MVEIFRAMVRRARCQPLRPRPLAIVWEFARKGFLEIMPLPRQRRKRI
jgi:hypothetical protein